VSYSWELVDLQINSTLTDGFHHLHFVFGSKTSTRPPATKPCLFFPASKYFFGLALPGNCTGFWYKTNTPNRWDFH